MYGIINQAIKDLVIKEFGDEKWVDVCRDASITTDDFVFMDYYPDKLTYQLVGSVSKISGLAPQDILFEFGKYWILFTAKEGYGPLMDLFGSDYRTCLMNLNNLHTKMGMTMPQLSPPQFFFKEINQKYFQVEYKSQRSGLCPMVSGLLEGLAIKFGHKTEIKYSENENNEKLFDIFILE